jgi:hypothetical protein
MPHARRKRKLSQFRKMSPPVVKQAAYGETRAAIHQKKAYEKQIIR